MGKIDKHHQLSAAVPQPPPGARLVAIRHKGKSVKPVRSIVANQICQRFVKDGNCPFGDQCPFKHPSQVDAVKLAESAINIKSHLERRRAENFDIGVNATSSTSDVSVAAKAKTIGEISELERKLAELKKQLSTLEEQTKQNEPVTTGGDSLPTTQSRSVSPEPQPAPEALAAVKQDAFKRAEMRKERRLEMAPYKDDRKREKKDKKKKKKKKRHHSKSGDESEEWPEGVYPIENFETGIQYDGEEYRPGSEWLAKSAPPKEIEPSIDIVNDVKQEPMSPKAIEVPPFEACAEPEPVKEEPMTPPPPLIEEPTKQHADKKDKREDRKRKREKEKDKESKREKSDRNRKERGKDKREDRKRKKTGKEMDKGKDHSKKKKKAKKGDKRRKEAEKIIKGDITFEVTEDVSSSSDEEEPVEEEKDETIEPGQVPALEKLHSLTDRYKLKKLRLHFIPDALSSSLKKELLKKMGRKKLPQYKTKDNRQDTKSAEWYAIAKFHHIDHSSLLIDTPV